LSQVSQPVAAGRVDVTSCTAARRRKLSALRQCFRAVDAAAEIVWHPDAQVTDRVPRWRRRFRSQDVRRAAASTGRTSSNSSSSSSTASMPHCLFQLSSTGSTALTSYVRQPMAIDFYDK